MKVQELRIGNLVHATFEDEAGQEQRTLCKVIAIDTTGSLGDGWDFMYESLDGNDHETYDDSFGIPLTDYWFSQLGFKPLAKDWQIKGLIIHTRKRGYVVNKRIHPIKCVHTLQNLYYALTGEELTLPEQQ